MIRLTNSEMKMYSRCKRQWWLAYYRNLTERKPENFNRPLGIGTRVHDALQMYYRPGDHRLADDDLWQYFNGGVHRDILEHPTQQEAIEKEADLAQRMLSGYFDWLAETGNDADIRVIQAEAEMEVPLIHDVATLLSKIDVRVEKISTGERGAIETKTVGDLKKPVRKLQMDSQLLTEHLVEFLHLFNNDTMETADENRAKFVIYNMLRKVKRTGQAKPPFYGREEVHHNLTELRNHWRHVVSIATQIAETRLKLDEGLDPHSVCPPNVTEFCDWGCEFAKPCLAGLFDDGSDVEAFIADKYRTHDPLERYATLRDVEGSE